MEVRLNVPGDRYNCECPHCKKVNHNITQGITVTFGKVISFQKRCLYCNEIIHYRASYEIRVDASTEDPFPT